MISEQSNPAGQEQHASDVPAVTAANMDENAAEFRFNETPGFGSRLRAVREARGLDLETCGHALRLPVRVLRQLEGNQFDDIDYQVYIGGYIRKYARYLEIDDAEAEAAVARLKPSQPPLVATGGISHSRYLLDRYATAATYVVLTLVIAVPTVWLGMRGTLSHDMSTRCRAGCPAGCAAAGARTFGQRDGESADGECAGPGDGICTGAGGIDGTCRRTAAAGVHGAGAEPG
jgi:cytoskeleton protein RodZ